MTKKIDQDVLIGFVEEAKSYLPRILDCIETFKHDHTQLESLEEAHRLFHSIKGAASMVGLSALSHIAYFAEETLEEIASEQLDFTQDTRTLFLLAVGQIESYLDGTLAGQLDERSILEDVVKGFRRLKGFPEDEDQETIDKLFASPLERTPAKEIKPAPARKPAEDRKPIESHPVLSAARATDQLDDASMELREAFLEEADEHLQNIARVLRLLEKDPTNKGWQQDVRRSVHTLKGAAGMVGFRTVSKLAHRMEDLLDAIYEDSVELSADMIALIFVTADTLEDLLHKGSAEVRERAEELYEQYAVFLGETAASDESAKPGKRLEPLGEEGMIDLTRLMPQGRRDEAASPEDEKEGVTQRQPSQVVRVPIERLDELVRLVSELIVSRSTFEQYFRGLTREVDELKLSTGRLQRISSRMETEYEASTLGSGLALSYRGVAAAGIGVSSSLAPHIIKNTHGFDELEFDRYTQFHLLTRELSENTSDINAVSGELRNTIGDFDSYLSGLSRLTSQVQDKLMRLRMVPLATLTSRLHRTVRVTGEHQSKAVKLLIEGEQVELDKTVLEDMSDPLLHILRNAVDHGIEPPALRQALGKPTVGKIQVRAFYESTQVVIQVSDDGAGIEPGVVREAAIRRGHISESEAAHLTEEEVYSFLFLPGFSTATEISEISGRGVGMDVVKETVTRMKGTVSIQSVPGQGTTLTIRLPMTLAILRVILVKANTETFALPLGPVTRILRVGKEEIEYIGQQPVVRVENTVYPLVRLGNALNLKQAADDSVSKVPVLILNLGSHSIALAVDYLLEAREVVVKSLGSLLQRVRGVAGATLMGDGSVVLILNPNELERETAHREIQPRTLPRATSRPAHEALKVLVVDDSVSVRRVLSNFVRNQGWNPTEAKDGVEALEIIQSAAVNPDIILLDIEMPRMDGYELTATLRSNNSFKNIPIVMLTSRAGDKHRQKAMDLGATDYLVKPYQEEVLLGVIRRLTQVSRGH